MMIVPNGQPHELAHVHLPLEHDLVSSPGLTLLTSRALAKVVAAPVGHHDTDTNGPAATLHVRTFCEMIIHW